MLFLSFLLPVFSLSFVVDASNGHDSLAARNRHHDKVARSFVTETVVPRDTEKRKCAKRAQKPKSSSSSSEASAPTPDPAETNSQSGLLRVQSDCGQIGATTKPSTLTGPNGDIDWLNCDIEKGGWRPQHVTVKQLIAVDLSEALKSSSSPFKACSKYLSLFEKYGKEHGLPPIMLASFALQESSCNPSTVGGGGEQGLMQITKDKCGAAPNGNCKDPDYNIKTAADYFAKTLASNDNNVILSIGQYNGWKKGMTKKQATAARYTKCCRCQNNLDYLHQFLNGWMQGINAYERHMGKYFNLDVCH